jgi:hypothetical protein
MESNRIYEAKVESILDWRTLIVTINNTKETVRMIGIGEPANTSDYALNYTKDKLRNRYIFVQTDSILKNEDNVIVAYILFNTPNNIDDKLEFESNSFNIELLKNNIAISDKDDKNTRYNEIFKKF